MSFGTLFDTDFVKLNEVDFCRYLMVFPPYLEVKASLKRLKALTSKYGGNETKLSGKLNEYVSPSN